MEKSFEIIPDYSGFILVVDERVRMKYPEVRTLHPH